MSNINFFISAIIPIMVLCIILIGTKEKQDVFKLFIEGAIKGLKVIYNIFPYILAITVSIGLLRSTGALDILMIPIKPILYKFGISKDIVPLFILRPLSGSASMSFIIELFKLSGPDSASGKIASIIMGGTETTIYCMTILLGAVGIKKVRGILIAGLIADFVAIITAIVIVNCGFI